MQMITTFTQNTHHALIAMLRVVLHPLDTQPDKAQPQQAACQCCVELDEVAAAGRQWLVLGPEQVVHSVAAYVHAYHLNTAREEMAPMTTSRRAARTRRMGIVGRRSTILMASLPHGVSWSVPSVPTYHVVNGVWSSKKGDSRTGYRLRSTLDDALESGSLGAVAVYLAGRSIALLLVWLLCATTIVHV